MHKLTVFIFLLFATACTLPQPTSPIDTAAIFQLTKAASLGVSKR
jgi:hypothetical protein